jgi:hypothetical protein
MAVKILISAEANSGKTTLTKNLENSLVVSHDGKRYPFPVPHVLVPGFDNVQELIDTTIQKIEAYNEKFNAYPDTIVFDSVSKIFDTIHANCNEKYKGFVIYSELDKEIVAFTSFIENSLIASNMNVVLISHALYDSDTAKYNLVGKGSFAKRGGFLAEVDEAIFIEVKSNKRTVHLRSTKLPARSLQEDLPDNVVVDDFNLQQHIEHLAKNASTVDDFAL